MAINPRRNALIAGLAVVAGVTIFMVVALHSVTQESARGCACPLYDDDKLCRFVDTCFGGARDPGGSITVAVSKAPRSWNIARGGVEAGEEEEPLLHGVFTFLPSGTIAWNRDLLVHEPRVTSRSPLQVVYQLNPVADWNDGTGRTHPVSAQDFVYTWQMFNNHDTKVSGIDGYDRVASVVGSTDDKTVTVTFGGPYGDWRGLFAHLEPYWFAAAATGADPTDATLMTDAQLEAADKVLEQVPKYSAGPYMIRSVAPDGSTIEVPNPAWYGKDKPTLASITFRPANDKQLVDLLQNKQIDGFTARPDIDMVQQLGNIAGINYEVAPSFAWEQLQFNTRNRFLRDPKLREAIMDVINVQELIDWTVEPFFPDAKPRYGHNLFPGSAGYFDIIKQVDPVEGTGSIAAAARLLSAAGYTGVGRSNSLRTPGGQHVTITLVHTDTRVRDATARLIASYLGHLGITVTDRVTRDQAGTLDRGKFDIVEFAISGGPLLSTNASLWSTGGTNNFTGWGDPRSDALLAQMSQTPDNLQQATLLNQQDQILTAAHVDLPLYQQPGLFAVGSQYVNLRLNDAGSYFTYNTQDWGLFKVAQ